MTMANTIRKEISVKSSAAKPLVKPMPGDKTLVTYRQLAKDLTGDEWTLGELAGLPVENLCTWDKTGTTGYDGHD